MELQLFNTSSEKSKIDKVLQNKVQITGVLREKSSILNPTIRVDGTAGIFLYNYAYIPEFHRYYFVIDVVAINNNIYDLSLSVDVLMSFSEQIKNVTAIAARSYSEFNLYLPDEEYKVDNRTLTQIQTIGKFSEFGYYLSVIGGYE